MPEMSLKDKKRQGKCIFSINHHKRMLLVEKVEWKKIYEVNMRDVKSLDQKLPQVLCLRELT